MQLDIILKELEFKAVRSSGPGGQHVNKTSSKVELIFYINKSLGLTTREKALLSTKLRNRIDLKGKLALQCGESRSQHRNKNTVINRFISLLQNNLKIDKVRKKTKPSKGAIQKRLDSKKKNALKKTNRKPPSY